MVSEISRYRYTKNCARNKISTIWSGTDSGRADYAVCKLDWVEDSIIKLYYLAKWEAL